VGVAKKAARKRAVGTREHIVAYLAEVHELFDASGMASTRLSAADGYPGSSVAFAQLLSGMERSGLIEREVRGKRTYRISLGLAHALGAADGAAPGEPGGPGMPGGPGAPGEAGEMARMTRMARLPGGGGTAGFDYDELARRLLAQVVRRLAAAEPGPGTPDGGRRGALTRPGPAARPAGAPLRSTAALAEENVRLRAQLQAARQAIELAAERLAKLPIATDLDHSEIVLLQRLLSPAEPESPGTPHSALDAPSLLG
jgi:hypothetical protein